jgi:prolyl-tRNA synthetase
MTQLFGETLRSAPAYAEDEGHKLLLRAGYMRPAGGGGYSLLPLGLRALRKIEAIVREEMLAIGGQEVAMPLVQPAEAAQRSGLWDAAGDELARLTDRAERPLVLAPSHEEGAAALAGGVVASYRQLPATLFQIATVFRDEPRPRGGLMRTREFTLMDSYAFARDAESLEELYGSHLEAFARMFERLGLESVVVTEAGGGEHEYAFLTDTGDDAVVLCEGCGYTSNLRAARFARSEPPIEEPQPLEKVATPGTNTIESLAGFLGVPASRTAKVVFFSADLPARGAVVLMALVRGDMEVSESKLRSAIGASGLCPADEESIANIGASAGYASPVGLTAANLFVVVDELIATSPNLVSGANQEGFHFINVNFGRDYEADLVADIAHVFRDAACPDCTAPLELANSIEIGSLHRFPLEYADRLDACFQDEDGESKPMHMASFGIGISRLLGCLADERRDDNGLVMPSSTAPYHVHLVSVAGGDATIIEKADRLYDELRKAGLEVLFDDRDTRGGVKFNDADLIGLPVRITIGARSIEAGGAEIKRRDSEDRETVPLAEVAQRVGQLVDPSTTT